MSSTYLPGFSHLQCLCIFLVMAKSTSSSIRIKEYIWSPFYLVQGEYTEPIVHIRSERRAAAMAAASWNLEKCACNITHEFPHCNQMESDRIQDGMQMASLIRSVWSGLLNNHTKHRSTVTPTTPKHAKSPGEGMGSIFNCKPHHSKTCQKPGGRDGLNLQL